MKKYVPHTIFLSSIVLIVVVAYALNIAIVGAFTGGIAAMITDPPMLVGAILIGALVTNQWKLLGFSILFSIAMAIYIHELNAPFRNNAEIQAELIVISYISRLLTVLIVAYIANIFRLMFNPNSSIKSAN